MPANDTYRATPQPVFQPRKRHSTVLGVRTNHWPKLIATCVIGIALFFAVGLIEAPVEKELSFTQQASMKEAYLDARDACVKARNKGVSSLSATELEDYEYAQENNITSYMTDEQLAALMPTTQVVYESVIPPIARLLLFIVAPVALMFGWLVEVGHGYSVRSTAIRVKDHMRRQRIYVLRRDGR